MGKEMISKVLPLGQAKLHPYILPKSCFHSNIGLSGGKKRGEREKKSEWKRNTGKGIKRRRKWGKAQFELKRTHSSQILVTPRVIYECTPHPTSRLPASQMTGKVKIKLLPSSFQITGRWWFTFVHPAVPSKPLSSESLLNEIIHPESVCNKLQSI